MEMMGAMGVGTGCSGQVNAPKQSCKQAASRTLKGQPLLI